MCREGSPPPFARVRGEINRQASRYGSDVKGRWSQGPAPFAVSPPGLLWVMARPLLYGLVPIGLIDRVGGHKHHALRILPPSAPHWLDIDDEPLPLGAGVVFGVAGHEVALVVFQALLVTGADGFGFGQSGLDPAYSLGTLLIPHRGQHPPLVAGLIFGAGVIAVAIP